MQTARITTRSLSIFLAVSALTCSVPMLAGEDSLHQTSHQARDESPSGAAARRIPTHHRPGPQVIFWQIIRNPQHMDGMRFSGLVIKKASQEAADGSFHVILTLRNKAGDEVDFDFWDKRGYNASLDSYDQYLGKTITIVLTYKYYGITTSP